MFVQQLKTFNTLPQLRQCSFCNNGHLKNRPLKDRPGCSLKLGDIYQAFITQHGTSPLLCITEKATASSVHPQRSKIASTMSQRLWLSAASWRTADPQSKNNAGKQRTSRSGTAQTTGTESWRCANPCAQVKFQSCGSNKRSIWSRTLVRCQMNSSNSSRDTGIKDEQSEWWRNH